MELKTLFDSYRKSIRKRIFEILEQKRADYNGRLDKNTDLFDTLKDFSTKGKMLRGSLFLFSASSYGKNIDESLLNIAASLELMHSALLIHDDIMDNDELRRGEKTVFAKYKENAIKMNLKDPKHYGISMGIVTGDIALFMAEEIATYCEDSYIKKLLQLYTRELRIVGIGQLLDFSYGVEKSEFSYEEIKKMYIDKSARYSFVLPISLGSIAASTKEEELKKIEKLGENIGLIFQLIDDDIGMFGNEEEIGKPIGSDIREDKKTLMRSLLMQRSDDKTKEYLKKIFGNKSVSQKDIDRVREQIIKLGVRGKIKNMIEDLNSEAKKLIDQLDIPNEHKIIYMDFLQYNISRTS